MIGIQENKSSLKSFGVKYEQIDLIDSDFDYEEIEKDLSKYVELLNNLEKQGFKIAVLFITDVIKNGSYVVYNDSAKEIIADSFNISDIKQGIYLQDIVSRKKQMLPNIMEVIEKKI